MKQRLTYLLPEGSGIDRADIQIAGERVNFTKADQASEQWRITLGLHELPEELRTILKDFTELHIRSASPWNHRLTIPLTSRLPSGLHIFLTPKQSAEDVPFCRLLRNLLGDTAARCSSLKETCTEFTILSSNSAVPSSYQYYRYSSLDHNRVGATFLSSICDPGLSNLNWCRNQVSELEHASSVDIDIDVANDTVTLTALWSANAVDRGDVRVPRTAREYHKFGPEDRLEIGVLEPQSARKSNELSLGGYLTLVGENDRPSPTLFSFPSRHHGLSGSSKATFTTSFQQPTGLHPKLQLKLPRRPLVPPKDTCGLYTYMTLPSQLFVDRYQLSDRLFLDSQNLVALLILAGEQDLEAPDWTTARWGSAALLQLAVPSSRDSNRPTNEEWTVTIPLHLRYLNGSQMPIDKPSEGTVEVAWPIVFWACGVEKDIKMSNNPFDRVNLGYDAIFGPDTVFYHIPPAASVTDTVTRIQVPVLPKGSGGSVQIGTLMAVTLGFTWICWQLLNATGSKGNSERRDRKRK